MRLEDKMKDYKKQTEIPVKEDKIMDTIRKSQDTFYQKEQLKVLTYWEFLWIQARLVQKRWWILQTLLLVCVGISIPRMDHEFFVQRSMGVAGVLFVVLIIPELWKNRTNHCMEIEAASYYSLRQIYAARILLFGIVDIFLLTIFCIVLHGKMQFTFMDLLIQFLFPMAVTACICFGLLCNKHAVNEITSIVLCLVWSAAWWMITLSEEVYTAIITPVWVLLFGMAVLFFALVVYKTLHNCKQCWEVKSDGNKGD